MPESPLLGRGDRSTLEVVVLLVGVIYLVDLGLYFMGAAVLVPETMIAVLPLVACLNWGTTDLEGFISRYLDIYLLMGSFFWIVCFFYFKSIYYLLFLLKY